MMSKNTVQHGKFSVDGNIVSVVHHRSSYMCQMCPSCTPWTNDEVVHV